MGVETIELKFSTSEKEEVLDITSQIEEKIRKSHLKQGLCHIYVPHATAAIGINENADPGILLDILDSLSCMVPNNKDYRHDRIDGNAVSHIKSALLGPSETLTFASGKLDLGTWQGILFFELDGPRNERKVRITLVPF